MNGLLLLLSAGGHKILVGWAKMYLAPLITGVYIRGAWSINSQENDIA